MNKRTQSSGDWREKVLAARRRTAVCEAQSQLPSDQPNHDILVKEWLPISNTPHRTLPLPLPLSTAHKQATSTPTPPSGVNTSCQARETADPKKVDQNFLQWWWFGVKRRVLLQGLLVGERGEARRAPRATTQPTRTTVLERLTIPCKTGSTKNLGDQL